MSNSSHETFASQETEPTAPSKRPRQLTNVTTEDVRSEEGPDDTGSAGGEARHEGGVRLPYETIESLEEYVLSWSTKNRKYPNRKLAKVKALEDMLLVTEMFFCPAYSLYLSSGNDDVIRLALVGSAPIPHAPGATAGAELGVGWWVQQTTGLFRNGGELHGEDSYTPLYMLKKIRDKRWYKRGVPPPVYEGDDLWTDVEPPWDPLDDEGNKDIFEDTVFD